MDKRVRVSVACMRVTGLGIDTKVPDKHFQPGHTLRNGEREWDVKVVLGLG
jgi:hypothetical protein